jgi:formiminoglutamate deiminase
VTGARYHAALAWLRDGPAADVLLEVSAGRFVAVTPGVPAPPDAERLAGIALPGLANAHSHAFHRALRGRTQTGRGDFWSWRERMYAVAAALDPDRYLALATAVYAEMALAGITCVGEFHYLHRDPDGRPYAEPNAMGLALVEAARRAGIRITLLDTLYLTADVDGAPLAGAQRRFGDDGLAGWLGRTADLADALQDAPHARVGAAVHSVRAVPAELLGEFAARTTGRPVHVHLSEQPAENAACLARHGRTPTALLADHGVLGPRTTAVHATHLTDTDVTLLGGHGVTVCLCPTTERELADGLGPAGPLAAAGSPICVGTDSHAAIDLLAEARGVELHERLRTRLRGRFGPAALIRAATATGHAAGGWDDAGRILPGARADLVCVQADSPRTVGVDPASIVFAATAADVTDVIVDGHRIVHAGRHATIEVAEALRTAIP